MPGPGQVDTQAKLTNRQSATNIAMNALVTIKQDMEGDGVTELRKAAATFLIEEIATLSTDSRLHLA
jgi:hypothetical protein